MWPRRYKTSHVAISCCFFLLCACTSDLPQDVTASNATFPTFLEADRDALCFRVRPIDTDRFFQWEGAYFELDREDGHPLNSAWRKNIASLASPTGLHNVQVFVKKHTSVDDRIFWSPSKSKRWNAFGPNGTSTTAENVLVKSSGNRSNWTLFEVGDNAVRELALSDNLLQRLTYPTFTLDAGTHAAEIEGVYTNDPSEPAWLDGCTLIRKQCLLERRECRSIAFVPSSFSKVRFVPLIKRDLFYRVVADKPTVAVTGATSLGFSPGLTSPFSIELGQQVGKELALDVPHIHLMASASMRGFPGAISADNDLTHGFAEVHGRHAVHFKGSNAVFLHGDAWKIVHGTSYVIEEAALDVSNNVKEAALMASATNPGSVALCANGGPTVAENVVRFLMLSKPKSVFTFTGFHGVFGKSGASGSFVLSGTEMEDVMQELVDLSPVFFGNFVSNESSIVSSLKQRPLTLLSFEDGHFLIDEFVMKPDRVNPMKMPGILEGQESFIHEYAKSCARSIARRVGRHHSQRAAVFARRQGTDNFQGLFMGFVVAFLTLTLSVCCIQFRVRRAQELQRSQVELMRRLPC